jgi:hypothetical protein
VEEVHVDTSNMRSRSVVCNAQTVDVLGYHTEPYKFIYVCQCQTNCITIEDNLSKISLLDPLVNCVDVLEDFATLDRRTAVGMQGPAHAYEFGSHGASEAPSSCEALQWLSVTCHSGPSRLCRQDEIFEMLKYGNKVS